MKQSRKIIYRLIIFFACLGLVISGTCLTVSAGLITKKVVFYNSDGELNVTDWNDVNENLSVENGTLTVPNNSDSDTRLISKEIAVKDEYFEDMATVKGKIRFNQLPKDEKFILAFGLSSVESLLAEPGNVEIEFTNHSGISVALVCYDQNGDSKTVAAPTKIGASVGGLFEINATLKNNQQLVLSINGREIIRSQIPVSGVGRIGFLQTGSCGASMSDFEVSFFKYERPENANVKEDFEKGFFNDNLFVSSTQRSNGSPSYLAIVEKDGNHFLEYRNTGLAFFGTKYSYSNFEMTFDILYYCRVTTKDENGKVIMKPANDFSVSIGDMAVKGKGDFYMESTELILFSQVGVSGYIHRPSKFRYSFKENKLIDTSTNEGLSVYIKMVDGNLKVGVKPLSNKSADYTMVCDSYYENFRSGPIKFWSTGLANCAIDNIVINNLDREANVKEVDYKSSEIIQKDFEYKPTKWKFKADKTQATVEEGLSKYQIAIICSALAGVIVIIACAVFSVILKKKAKGVVRNEE